MVPFTLDGAIATSPNRDRAISEYWLIDPDAAIVTIYKLVETQELGRFTTR
ncbi:MAG: hypothetical protein HC925_03730 [Coleofasciculaceae cyanobacterium SM2_3_26]|nr:hypothetical protein [Coleofasciculaceae cyanobacterium SM2_3_26]